MSAADLPQPPDMARIERLAALPIAANACDMELTTEHAALFLDQKPEQFPRLARIIGHRDINSLRLCYNTSADELADRL